MRSNVVGSVVVMRYTFCLLIRSGTLNEKKDINPEKVLNSIEKGREKDRARKECDGIEIGILNNN